MDKSTLPISTAIILAGGLGTRLKSVSGDIPKPMVKVNDTPFLTYLLEYLSVQGIKHVVLAVGYKHEMISSYYGHQFKNVALSYAVEKNPLGTGGAIYNALELVKEDHCFVLNGDTYFPISLVDLAHFHLNYKADCSIALKHVKNADRYGAIIIDENGKINAFEEKAKRSEQLINGGIYCIQKDALNDFSPATPFSLESDFFENKINQCNFYGLPFEAYFKDIGIPTDFYAFENDIKHKTNH